MRWPWQARAEHLHEEAEAAAQEREDRTTPLVERARAAVEEAHQSEDRFREALENMMRQRRT